MERPFSPLTPTAMSRVSALLLLAVLTACAEGEYRLPYPDGTDVFVTRDFITHTGPSASMYDMKAVDPPALITASASGWVRFIEDGNTGHGEGDNNYIWIEHPYPYCQNPNDPARATWPRKPADYDRTCKPCLRRYCNEWTVYAHMETNSVTGTGPFFAGLEEGDWVEAGQLLGIESDIGHANGVHVHWHVAVIDPEWTPSAMGDYEAALEEGGWPERIPVVCTAAGKQVLWRNFTYTAAPCP